MQVLIVDGYAPTKLGRSSFSSFRTTVTRTLEESCKGRHDVVVRKINNLKDYVCDWAHDILNENLKLNCLKFDKIDLICICGDMKITPWDPLFTHAIILLHMATLCEKPVFGAGAGAFAGMYRCATRGARFNILNGPLGESIDRLATYPRFSIGTVAYPSGWLDSNTGDVYSFDRLTMQWRPMCNIGQHR